MRKLLVLGSDYGTLDIVHEAKKRGIYVIVADLMETSPTKEVADEVWLISTTDTDLLEQKCREVGVTAVITGASDFNIARSRELGKRLNFPLYCASDRAWEVATNKSKFKKLCKKVGAPVATDYYLTDALTENELKDVKYPVVVKPVDKSGNRGMSYCKNREELVAAYKYARSISDNATIIVERELHGPEFAVNYVLADGEISLLYFSSEHNQPGYLENMYSIIYTQSADLKKYINEVNDSVKKVFKEAGCREGVAWVETILDEDGHFYLQEMGYRFGGEMTYVPYERVSGFNTIKWMIDIALGIKHIKEDLPEELNTAYRGCACSYFLFSTKEGCFAPFQGIDIVEKLPNVMVDCPKRNGGITRCYASMGIIRIAAKDVDELCDTISVINENLRIEDENGEPMYVKFDDFVTIKERYIRGLSEFDNK